MYYGDAVGAILILLLCGMLVPILLVLTAAALDVLLLGWASLDYVRRHVGPRGTA